MWSFRGSFPTYIHLDIVRLGEMLHGCRRVTLQSVAGWTPMFDRLQRRQHRARQAPCVLSTLIWKLTPRGGHELDDARGSPWSPGEEIREIERERGRAGETKEERWSELKVISMNAFMLNVRPNKLVCTLTTHRQNLYFLFNYIKYMIRRLFLK